MPILRKYKNARFTCIDNNILNNKELSIKAKGLLCYMLSKPDGWDFNYNNFMNELKEGRKCIQSVLKELRDLKYLKMERFKNENNKYEWNYTIYEEPFENSLKNENFEQTGFEPIQVEPIQNGAINKNLNNKDKIDKEIRSYYDLDHNRLTNILIDRKYITKDDRYIFDYDDIFNEYLSNGYEYRVLLKAVNYVIDKVEERNYKDENEEDIKNKYAYFKISFKDSINKQLGITYETDEIESDDDSIFYYDWLNDSDREMEDDNYGL